MNSDEEHKTTTTSARVLELYDEGLSVNAVKRTLQIPYSQVRKALLVAGRDLKANVAWGKHRAPSYINGRGYRELFDPQHPNANAAGYVKEHVAIASKALGRALKPNEIVHHWNGNKLDNRNENLLICTRSYHSELHWRMGELYQKEHFPQGA